MPGHRADGEALADGDCLALAATVPVGRLVYTERALPVIVPVNFGVVAGNVVIRTGRQSRLANTAAGHVVVFEVDHIDTSTRAGWMVLLTGRIEVVDDPGELARPDGLKLPTWTSGPTDSYIRLHPDIVTGQRLPHARAACLS